MRVRARAKFMRALSCRATHTATSAGAGKYIYNFTAESAGPIRINETMLGTETETYASHAQCCERVGGRRRGQPRTPDNITTVSKTACVCVLPCCHGHHEFCATGRGTCVVPVQSAETTTLTLGCERRHRALVRSEASPGPHRTLTCADNTGVATAITSVPMSHTVGAKCPRTYNDRPPYALDWVCKRSVHVILKI